MNFGSLVGIALADIVDYIFARDSGATLIQDITLADVVGELCDTQLDLKRTLGLKRCEIDYNLLVRTFDNEYIGGEGSHQVGDPGPINIVDTDNSVNHVFAEDEFELVNLCFKSVRSEHSDPIVRRWIESVAGVLMNRPMLFLLPDGNYADGFFNFAGYLPAGSISNANQRMGFGFPGNSFGTIIADPVSASMLTTPSGLLVEDLVRLPAETLHFEKYKFNDVADYYGQNDVRWTFATVPARDAFTGYEYWHVGSAAVITSAAQSFGPGTGATVGAVLGVVKTVMVSPPGGGAGPGWAVMALPAKVSDRRIQLVGGTPPGGDVTIVTPGASTYTRPNPGPPAGLPDILGEHREGRMLTRRSIRFWRSP